MQLKGKKQHYLKVLLHKEKKSVMYFYVPEMKKIKTRKFRG